MYGECNKSDLYVVDDCHQINDWDILNQYQMSYRCGDDKKTVVFKSETFIDFFTIEENTIGYNVCEAFSKTLESQNFKESDETPNDFLKKMRSNLTKKSDSKMKDMIEKRLSWDHFEDYMDQLFENSLFDASYF